MENELEQHEPDYDYTVSPEVCRLCGHGRNYYKHKTDWELDEGDHS